MKNITESASFYENLESMSILEIVQSMNQEDKRVAQIIESVLGHIEALSVAILARMRQGGRLFYIGAGTSGRLGVLDASECPPTFGVPHGLVIGLIAGGDGAIRKAVEFAEDDTEQAWKDILVHQPSPLDSVVGLAASGRTPYVVGGLQQARAAGLLTGCVVCNPGSAVAAVSDWPVEVVVGPEFLRGSTRLKAGTAQKMVINMISTSIMIGLGRVKGNKMVDMSISNKKLAERGQNFLVEELHISSEEAADLLKLHGSVRAVLEAHKG